MKRLSAAIFFLSGYAVFLSQQSDGQTDTLKRRSAQRQLLIGTAVANNNGFGWSNPLMNDASYLPLITSDYYIWQPQNDSFWALVEGTQGNRIWTYVDQVAAAAVSARKRLRDCCTMWNTTVARWKPTWYPGSLTGSQQLATVIDWAVAKAQHFATNYPGLLYSEDVANEFLSGTTPSGSTINFATSADHPTLYTESALPGLGTGSTDLSSLGSVYAAVKAVDPTIKLCINEYGNNGNKSDYELNAGTTGKFKNLLNLIDNFQANGYPLDCVGFQFHMNSVGNSFTYANFTANVNTLQSKGIEVHISEFDVQTNLSPSAGDLTAQAAVVQNVVNICYANLNCKILQWWGATDLYSWICGGTCDASHDHHPLLYDTSYAKKALYTTASSVFPVPHLFPLQGAIGR